MRLFSLAWLLLAGVLATSSCRAQPVGGASGNGAPDVPEGRLEQAELAAHLRFLASDELMGREAGTYGADVAARYIAERFRAAGVEPVPGADGFFQRVPLHTVETGGGVRYALGEAEGGDETIISYNVAGMVEGSDPELRDEFVVLTAHYDHVGAGMDKGPGAAPADTIFNGARDNGMGTVALLGAAEALAADPPARSVLILAVTAEEKGLLGSRYYVEHPLLPLDRMVYVLNIDAGGYSDTSVVTLVGLGRTTADDAIRAGAGAFGLEVISDPAPEQNLFDRSDNVNFARAGIPAPTFSPGFRAFTDPGVADYYHRPADEADDDFDFAYLRRFVQAYVHTARRIADLPERPRWHPDDKYAPAAEALYGR